MTHSAGHGRGPVLYHAQRGARREAWEQATCGPLAQAGSQVGETLLTLTVLDSLKTILTLRLFCKPGCYILSPTKDQVR